MNLGEESTVRPLGTTLGKPRASELLEERGRSHCAHHLTHSISMAVVKSSRVTMRSWRRRRFAVGKRRRGRREGVGRFEGGGRCCRITACTDIVVEDKEVAIMLPDHGAGPPSATPGLSKRCYTGASSDGHAQYRRPNSSSRLRSYKFDGPGVVYIVGRVRTTVYNSYIAKQTSHDDFLDALEVKVGHSKNFKARRRAYKRCAGEHTLFWHATYTTRWK
ncbi:hypothetical protein B0H11DRAFT_1901461 [Mycena galericulata]|nr:hypothetical protein B0H11DRAFT_1901461 [Mycena galericulata]